MARDPEFTISPDHPALPGHFPGRPIVPGVVLLHQVRQLLHRYHPQLADKGIKKLKFLGIIKPGEAFCVRFAAFKNGGIRFTCYAAADDRVVAQGHLAASSEADK